MKVIIFGYGSIGKRHFDNLKLLRPDVERYRHDPPKGMRVIDTPPRYDAAIIATPTESHGADMEACAVTGTPFYVEKPLGTLTAPAVDRCAVGHQYRFHAAMPDIISAAHKHGVLHFRANDDLWLRYGSDVDGIMAAHPIDTALWLLGPATSIELVSDGINLHGSIEHERGLSTHIYQINKAPRTSIVTSGKTFDLPADNQMYLDALNAWLTWVEGGERDPRTCTLNEALAVMQVLAQVRHAKKA